MGNTTVVHNLAATVTVTGSADAQALFEGTERPSSMPFGTSASAGSTTAVEPTSVPWHPMPRLRGRGLWQRSQRSLAPFLQDADVTSEHREADGGVCRATVVILAFARPNSLFFFEFASMQDVLSSWQTKVLRRFQRLAWDQ